MIKLFIFSSLLLIFSACGSTETFDTSTVAGQFKEAESYEKSDRFQMAIIKYSDLRNQHPYSRFATLAELKIADIHFKREAYSEAKLAYELFQEYHPTHPKTDYVIFRIALSAFHEIPESIDRDLNSSKAAISTFDQLLQRYPNSKFSKEARIKKAEIFKKLALKELYVADFYMKRKNYESALARYENVVLKFPKLGLSSRALYGAGIAAFESKNNKKGKLYADSLIKDYPQSSEASSMKSKVGNYGKR
ncbi:MAG: outer membrane protein assembly factor BamD [Bdellovibrionales bacterium]